MTMGVAWCLNLLGQVNINNMIFGYRKTPYFPGIPWIFLAGIRSHFGATL